MSTPEEESLLKDTLPIPAAEPQAPVEESREVLARFFDRVEGRWVETPLMGISCKDEK
jgi:hypothetical protein